MTDRLYYADPYCREFDATVRRVDRIDDRFIVALDRTAFYPTSGGQPFDTGELSGVRVVDVFDGDDGAVLHALDVREGVHSQGRAPNPGDSVRGTIDWSRRFDHMQQHTGQHVLSAACDRLSGARTVSFHLGTASSTIDLARELSREELTEVEAEANRVVWEDHPVSIRFVGAAEAATLPLRKESAREGVLRLIDIDGYDLSACGGTHVARTGSIGVIALGSVERFKGGQRVEFFCGGRALQKFGAMRDTIGGAVRLLSVLPEEVPGAVERLLAESREQKRAASALEVELARFRAGELAARAEITGAGRLVLAAVDADAQHLKSLASAIASQPGFIVLLASASRPALVVAARSQDLSFGANQLIATLTARFGGRGGGRPDLAQAGGLDATADAILEVARAQVTPTS
jgi:alanyl-tRNA synthetase